MRTTVDIPDALYRELKGKAAKEGRSVKEIILRSVEEELQKRNARQRRRITAPLVPSKHPGTLDIDNEGIFEIIPFP
jgi:cytidylate kinase